MHVKIFIKQIIQSFMNNLYLLFHLQINNQRKQDSTIIDKSDYKKMLLFYLILTV